MFTLLSGAIAVLLYLGASVLLLQHLRSGAAIPVRAHLALVVPAVALHAAALYGYLLTPTGLQLGFFHSLSLAGWMMSLMLLLIALRQPVQNLGIGVFPLAAVTLAASLAWGGGGPVIATDHAGLDAHVLISICAYGVLGLAAIQALVLSYQQHVLHDHHGLGAVRGLPALSVMETLLFRLIAIGFVLLTAALASGLLFLDDMFAQQMVHKTVLTLLAWALFAILLAGHWLWGWRGRTAVRLTIGGIILLVLGYSGSKLVIEIILRPD